MVGRLMGLLRRHPYTTDTALAVLVAIIAILIDVLGPDSRAASAPVWDVLLAAPLVLRRRRPTLAAAAIGILCLLQWFSGTLAEGDVVVLVMLYTLGAWERRTWVLGLAIVVAEVGVVMAALRWAPQPEPWLAGLLLSGTVTSSWVIGAYVRMRRAYLSSVLERAETAERDRDSQARIAVADERARMAREMHDIVAHGLSVMITLNDATVAVAPDGPLRDTAAQASEVGRQALTEMQRLLGVLRDDGAADLAPQPGMAQLPDLVGIVRSAGPQVDLAVSGDPAALGPSAELAVYRIVQESLTNVLKHATNVVHVRVELTYLADRLTVCVRNDGDPVTGDRRSADRPTGGQGLVGMRERAGLYGGQVAAEPAPGGGWVVTAQLPTRGTAMAR